MSYVARRVLEEAGIGLGDLVREKGRSKTTWSRFLDGEREPQSGDARADVEDLLRARGHRIPADLWARDGETEAPGAGARNATREQEEVQMQGQALSAGALRHFKLFANPFDPEALLDPSTGGDRLDDLHLPLTHQLVLQRLIQAYTKAGFVALAGEPGSGKSTLNALAFRRANEIKTVTVVGPANVERRKMTAMHVSAEIIRQLSEESVPRTANTRDALATEILRQRYEQGQRVALVIDEAHELPTTTIKDLKRYHELSHGFARLLAIILLGQPELANRFDLDRNFRLREVIIRLELFQLPPMRGEVAEYLARRFQWVGKDIGDVFEPEALQALDARLAVHDQQYPVLMGNVATAAMNIAARRGNERVSEDDVEAVWSYTPEELQELGL